MSPTVLLAPRMWRIRWRRVWHGSTRSWTTWSCGSVQRQLNQTRHLLLSFFDCFKALENCQGVAVVPAFGCSEVEHRNPVDRVRDPCRECHRHVPLTGVELTEIRGVDAG